MFIGFQATFVGSFNSGFIDWKHQPFGRGANARPIAEDSSVVTVQIAPTFLPAPTNEVPPPGFRLEDFYATLIWSAAGQAVQRAEVDLQRGVSFSLIATHVRAVSPQEIEEAMKKMGKEISS